MRNIHLEGMGLQGALLAHRLAKYGVPFTWNDIDAEHTAWKASTGAIYPADSTNHGPDRECYDIWKSWYESDHFLPQHLERSSGLVFCTKSPPHKGKYEVIPLKEGLNFGTQPSFHFNAQTFVPYIRHRFRAQEKRQTLTPHDRLIVTHGWGERLDRAYWGWTRLVKLAYSFKIETVGLTDVKKPVRPAFYFRPNRYTMAYAYPVPGTNWYYAGSSIIQQRIGKFHNLEAASKYEKWKQNFEALGRGQVEVTHEGEYLTGWRPAAAPTDEAWIRRKGNVLTLRPLWNSGIRHFPQQWVAIATQLGLVP